MPYSFGKKYNNILLSCQKACWSSFYILVTFCNIVLIPLFSFLSTSSPPLVHRHAFPHCFFVVFLAYFTWCWFDAFLLLLLLFVKCLQLKFVFLLATALGENLTQVVFCQPFVIRHVRTQSLNCETWNLLCFYQHIINSWSLILLYFLLLHSCFFMGSHKNAWIKHTIITNSTRTCFKTKLSYNPGTLK